MDFKQIETWKVLFIYLLTIISVVSTSKVFSKEKEGEISQTRLGEIIVEIKASEDKPLGIGFEDEPIKALERLEAFEKMEAWEFRKETGLKLGLAGLIIYLKRKSILKTIMYITKLGSNIFSSRATLGLVHSSKYLTAIGMFVGLYFHSADAGNLEDTLTGYYYLYIDNFLDLPLERKIELLTIYDQRRPEPSVLLLRQKIFALDKFLEAAVKTAEIEDELEDINSSNGVDFNDPEVDGFFTY